MDEIHSSGVKLIPSRGMELAIEMAIMSRNNLFPSIHGLVISLSRLCFGVDHHPPTLIKYTSLVLITSNKLKLEAL